MINLLRWTLHLRLVQNVMASGGSEIKSTDLYYSVISVVLILFSGFCSGATQCLLSIDQITLEVKQKYGNAQEQRMANRILPIISEHHLLLSTLLVANAISNESLPIFLHQVVSDWIAILISVGLVVIIGEVIPSAFMTGPLQMQIASSIVGPIKCLESVLYLICYPLSKVLDYVLGYKSKRYHLQYIRALIELHEQEDVISSEELRLIAAIMELRNVQVLDRMVPIGRVYYVMSDEPFCKRMAATMRNRGYSVMPIIENNIVIGTFRVLDLLLHSVDSYGMLVHQLVKLQRPIIVDVDCSMLELMRLFLKYKTSTAFVYGDDLMGMISLNDLFNSMADDTFIDEDNASSRLDRSRY